MNTLQSPIRSPFGAASTARDVIEGIDLSGKVAIVTGGYSGIGLETTKAFANAGATVIVPARNVEKAEKALKGIGGVEIAALDLIDPTSIDTFAEQVLAVHHAIHLLVNNAGYIGLTLEHDARGYEAQFATNHLGHFQLTARLWSALVNGHARVVTVSSCGHAAGAIDFDDINFETRGYDPMVAYGQSKSANALFSVWLDRLGQPHGVRAFALHPGGIVESGFTRDMPIEASIASGYRDADGKAIIDPQNNKKTPEQGAATQVWCATSPLLDGMGGVYCEDCNIAQAVPADCTELLGVRPWAIDPSLAEHLWKVSEEMTGVTF
ncbi:SDR family NAD(P)-dependent oxidoreductase [Roseospira marina]|uniref:SDR family NAD(P)-dependent oxidoreductase n=1 Tax=Roseospira marina TaxID=140057 RepID=A0A5M6IDR5_9PROT|nr:oxidoreductase [Roseospira marina]KAA5606383.1 SDR family NAD(P)-dependent oxidoreductase [Roseospira marina]MBB4314213.1 NAD(P)-dependent dehydrogenase (short-subunit alcohol dehydrogenase family) [Roseospira marina]MBB5087374.1 NAD(P)-dependent dehydrogenase (short-subunit alcohol dehydrogenase family) [Roseospira marina]